MRITAAVTKAKGEPFVLEEVELDEPQNGEILVRIVASGICHTDEAVQHQFIPTPLPAVLGHKGAGIVEKVGPGVTEFKVGDRVGISYAFCNECTNCRKARYFVCKNLKRINFGGIQPDGTTRLHTRRTRPQHILRSVIFCNICCCKSEPRSKKSSMTLLILQLLHLWVVEFRQVQAPY